MEAVPGKLALGAPLRASYTVLSTWLLSSNSFAGWDSCLWVQPARMQGRAPRGNPAGCLPTKCSQRGHGSLQTSVATRPGSELPARGRQRKHPGRLLGETRGHLYLPKMLT